MIRANAASEGDCAPTFSRIDNAPVANETQMSVVIPQSFPLRASSPSVLASQLESSGCLTPIQESSASRGEVSLGLHIGSKQQSHMTSILLLAGLLELPATHNNYVLSEWGVLWLIGNVFMSSVFALLSGVALGAWQGIASGQLDERFVAALCASLGTVACTINLAFCLCVLRDNFVQKHA